MSIRYLSRAWEEGPEDREELLVFLVLADHADERGMCYPSMETIGRKARMTDRGARNVVRRLEAAGYLTIEKGGGRGRSSRYHLQFPAQASEKPDAAEKAEDGSEIKGGKGGTTNPELGAGKPTNPERHDTKPGTSVPRNRQEPEVGVAGGTDAPEGDPKVIPLRPISQAEPDDAELLERVMRAAGVEGFPTYWMPPASTVHVGNWRRGLGLTAEQIVGAIRDHRRARSDRPPAQGPKAYDRVLADYASALSAPLPAIPAASINSTPASTRKPHGPRNDWSKADEVAARIDDTFGQMAEHPAEGRLPPLLREGG